MANSKKPEIVEKMADVNINLKPFEDEIDLNPEP